MESLPCRVCGAPLRVDPGRIIDLEVQVSCPWCSAQERLPADQAERVKALQLRTAERAWAEQAARGPALALSRMAEGGIFGAYTHSAVNMGFMIALVSVMGGLSLASSGLGATEVVRGVIRVAAPLVGALLGMALAWFPCRRRIRRLLRPILTAAAPPVPGQSAGCRRCGAPLPPSSQAVVDCAHCRAPNLVSRAALAERARHLAQSAAQARADVRGHQQAVAGITRRTGVVVAGGLLLGLLLGAATGFALG